MSHQVKKSSGFTLIELLVVISIIALLLGILVPVLGIAKKNANKLLEATNLTSMSKGLAVFGQTNKDWYPGLTNTGKFSSNSPFVGNLYCAAANATSTNGDATGFTVDLGNNYAIAQMLDEGLMAPKQLVSPGETGAQTGAAAATIAEILPATQKPVAADTSTPTQAGVVDRLDHSFALLPYAVSTLRPEWKATTNQQAIVIGTRLVFTAGVAATAGTYSSTWTEDGSGKWEGALVRNDTSTAQEKFSSNAMIADQFKSLKYGSVVNPLGCDSSATVCAVFGKSGATAAVATTGTTLANYGCTTTTATGTLGKLGSAND